MGWGRRRWRWEGGGGERRYEGRGTSLEHGGGGTGSRRCVRPRARGDPAGVGVAGRRGAAAAARPGARPCLSPPPPARRSPEQKLERKRKVVTPRVGAATWGPGGRGEGRVTPGSALPRAGKGTVPGGRRRCQREVRAEPHLVRPPGEAARSFRPVCAGGAGGSGRAGSPQGLCRGWPWSRTSGQRPGQRASLGLITK
ncbi:PREDICTED: uncharacterized protein FLJ37310-like [Lepidothrix coronata]|uniref:Uncharacterized protein FLJ37310-like n=1 Tax=Lepidothrix coronata TaxID=321398 RepID=A0A6J0HUD5_9PASS|nr:PREDICTED: uncharacterized protein FLJ37310-like [Lepidothrix coronata]